MTDVDRLVEIITQRVQERLGGSPARSSRCCRATAASATTTPRPARTARAAGSCVVRRPWSVRAMEGAGAMRVGAAPGVGAVPADLAQADRSHAAQARGDARRGRQAVRGGAASTASRRCASNTTWVPLCKALLAGTDVMVCAVVGFPLGAMAPHGQGLRGARGGAPGRARDRHGDQHRRAQVARLRDRVRGHLPGRQGGGAGRGEGHPRDQRARHRGEDHRLHAVQARRRGVRQDLDRLRQGRRDRRGRRS